MGSRAQSQTFFTLWIHNFQWVLSLLFWVPIAFFIFPAAVVGKFIVSSLIAGISGTFAVVSFFVSWLFTLGDFAAGALWLFLRFSTPLCWSIFFFLTGLDVPAILANLFRFFWQLLIFFGIVGPVLAVFTWWGFQNETQQAIDAVYCQLVALQEPVCNFYNLAADLYETLAPAFNLVLDVLYDFLQAVFDGLLRFVGTLFGLIVRFAADPIGETQACSALGLVFSREPFCVSSGTPNAPNQCVLRELYCLGLDALNLIIVEIIGGVIRLFTGNTVANFAVNGLIGQLEGIILQFDLAISVINPSYFIGCDTSFIGLTSTVQQARMCYNDRNRCPQNRLLCYVLFWIRLVLGGFQAVCDFVFAAIDVALSGVFGPIGDLLKRFLRTLSTVIDILEDPVGWFEGQFTRLITPIKQFLEGLISANLRRITRIITDPRGTINNLVGVILGIVQDNPLDFAQAISSQMFNLLDIGGIRGLISGLQSALSGGGLFGRRRLLGEDEKAPDLPLIYTEEIMEKAKALVGENDRLAHELLAAYEIEHGYLKRESGVSDKCFDLLKSYDGFPEDMSTEADDIMYDDAMWCVNQYANTRHYYQKEWNMTTWPDYHLQTGSTWLPEDDYCKPVLERDLFGHLQQLERDQAKHFDDHGWWWDEYAPCAKEYADSFMEEYRVYNNGSETDNIPEGVLYFFKRPTEFLTKNMADQEYREDKALAMRLALLPNRVLPTYRYETVGYKMLRYAQHVRVWFHEYHKNVPEEHAYQQQREAVNMMRRRPTTLHTIGEYSIYADKIDPKTNKTRPGLGSVFRPVHDKMADFNWAKTFGEVLVNWGNTTHLQQLRENAVQVSLAGTLRVAGGVPVIHTRAKYRPWRHVKTLPVARSLLQLTPRDFNLNEIIRNSGERIANFFIIVFKTIAIILKSIGLPGFETVAMLSEMVVEEIENFDYGALLDRIVDFALSYFNDIIDSLDCSPPDWYDARSNPDGPWKCQCLLQLKLPPLLPRWPDFTQITIPWGSPCRAEKKLCGWDGSFPGLDFPGNFFDDVPLPLVNQVPCEAGYRDCAELGFTDGFDILIWVVELISIETGIDMIGYLRSEEVGIIVSLGLNFAAAALYPLGWLFGFTDTLNDFIGATSLRELPYIGPIVFRFADFPTFPEGPFYSFCIGWGYALATLPLIITIALFISFGYYLFEVAGILLSFARLIYGTIRFPTGILSLADTERFKERWDDPVWVYEQNPDIYDDESGAVNYSSQAVTNDTDVSSSVRQRL